MEGKLHRGDRVALVCCSDGLQERDREQIEAIKERLRLSGLVPAESPYIYRKDSVFSGTGLERAEALMQFYRDDSVKAIFDISGGDIANELLDKLDFAIIGRSEKSFFGYSDLTVLLNAIYAEAGRSSGLYQIRNLSGRHGAWQAKAFENTFIVPNNMSAGTDEDLCHFSCKFIQGKRMAGIVIGGNMRCFLKLAGTKFLPDFTDKILFLESNGGETAKILAMINQLKQMGAFEKVTGILLGTFRAMEKNGCIPTVEAMIMEAAGGRLPVAKTSEIGHGSDSRCLIIGEELVL